MKNDKVNIVISGWYGPGNVGDETILYSIKLELEKKYPNCELTVMSFRPKQTHIEHNLKAIYQLPQSFVSFVFSLLTFRFFKTIRAITKCHLFVMGGGGFLSDRIPKTPQTWLFQMRIAKLFKKQTILYKIGAGPFYSVKGRNKTKFYIDKYVDTVIVRDLFSYNELTKNVQISNENIKIEIDPVAKTNFNSILEEKNTVEEISLIYTPFFGIETTKNTLLYKELKKAFILQIDLLLAKKEKIQIIYFRPDIEQELHHFLSEKYTTRIKHIFIHNFTTGVNVLNNSKAVISFRLHGNIIAHNLNVPFLPIIYHFKTQGFLDEAGYSNEFPKIDIREAINWSDWEIQTINFLRNINK